MVVVVVLVLLLILITIVHSFNRLKYDNLEQERWREVVDSLRHNNISLKVFYHASKWQQHWKEVIQEHVNLLGGKRTNYAISSQHPYGINESQSEHPYNNETGSAGYYWIPNKRFVSILDYASDMLINVAGDDISAMYDVEKAVKELNLTANLNKIKFNFNQTVTRELFRTATHDTQQKLMKKRHLTEGEISTIDLLHKYCINEKKNNRKAFVLYFHSKGGCCVRRGKNRFDPMPVAAWRETMNTFTVEFPSICVRSLLSRYVACGYNSQDSSFSGNFFWTDCDHVAMLPSVIQNRFDAWAAEFFIFNVSNSYGVRTFYGAHCGYSPYNCKEDHYKTECPKQSYEKKLLQLVENKSLPENVGRLVVEKSYSDILKEGTWNDSFCDLLRNQKFEDTTYFTSPSVFVNLVESFHSDKKYFRQWQKARVKEENKKQQQQQQNK